ncbi:MAG: hypothetical protein IMY84_01405 [Chloroflexi bacterium]|nr:hypothetical protein [Chloroflexota bacterium]
MHRKLGDYVSALCGSLRIDSRARQAIDREFRAHLEDHCCNLRWSGLSEEEASDTAIESFGNAQLIAQGLSRVHSKGTWQDAFLTSLPHLLVAMLLTVCFRYGIACGVACVLATTAGVYHAASRRAPSWSFSLMGYCLLPFIVAVFLLLDATRWWTILGVAYIPCAVLLLVYVIRLTASRDVLYVSLMMAPLAVVFAWCMATQRFGDLQMGHVDSYQLHAHARELVGSFIALAISSFVFARVARRWGKALALIVPPGVVLAYVTLRYWEGPSLWGWLVFALALVLVSAPTLREFRE